MSKIFRIPGVTNTIELFGFSSKLCQNVQLGKKFARLKSNFCENNYKKLANPIHFLEILSQNFSNSVRIKSFEEDEKPKISVLGEPCVEPEPMTCKDCKPEQDPDIISVRRKTEGAVNCFREPKPASGKCIPKRQPTLGSEWTPIKRQYSTTISTLNSLNYEIRFKCHGPCARKREHVQKLRNVTEGCCIPKEKPPCEKIVKIQNRNPSNLIVVKPCTILPLTARPIINKIWEERGCSDLRMQTEGPPCKRKCLSTFRMPGCNARQRVICDFAPFYYMCTKNPCPKPSFSEFTDPPPKKQKDHHQCTDCPKSRTAPWEAPPRAHGCPTCKLGQCQHTWSVDPYVLKRLGVLYRDYSTIVKFPVARKIDPTIEERCLQEKCKKLDNPDVGTDLCPITPECDTPELRDKYCKKPYPNTWTCVEPKPSEGKRCVSKATSKTKTKCICKKKAKKSVSNA